uniref:Lymphocyte antigen 86 n=1 Tax=Sus scrofa TaxID=9823 RepID=A0A287AN09_PIG
MRGFTATLLVWTLVSPQGGGGEAWPTHVACRDGNLEVLYQSCDPLQDFGFSVDQCSKQLKPNLHIRFGIILRQDIRELFLDVALFSQGSSILNFSYPICERICPSFPSAEEGKESRFITPALLIISDLKFPRESTRFCWSCTTRTTPPWPAPMPRSSAPERLGVCGAVAWQPRLLPLNLPRGRTGRRQSEAPGRRRR